MNGKENIINKILADADLKCNEIIAAAQCEAQQIADSAQAFDQKDKENLSKRLEQLSDERKRNNLVNAQLAARKYKLQQKQQLISDCYDKAQQQILSLPAAKKKDFLTKLIKTYAEKGETVCIAKEDKDIVTQKFLDGFNMKLTLGKNFIDAKGGIVLEGDGYDKDLTIEKLLAFAREQTEAKVAEVLFRG